MSVQAAVVSGRSRSRRPRIDNNGQIYCLSCDDAPASPKSPWCAEHRAEARRTSSRIAHAERDAQSRAVRLGPQRGIQGVAPNLPDGSIYDPKQGMYLASMTVAELAESITALRNSATAAKAYLAESDESLERDEPMRGREIDRRHFDKLIGAAFSLLHQANYLLVAESPVAPPRAK